ncbi:MAG: FixH family protein [Bacteroidota bacterium]|nr:FixH family protein [Bacteroidota bacterium]
MRIKFIRTIYIIIIATGFIIQLSSCSTYDIKTLTPQEEVAGLTKLNEITKGDYTFYVFKKDTGSLKVGYNEVYIQLKNNTTGKYIENANLSWKPLMHMSSMSHACPYSAISKVDGANSLYKGYFIFIMASDATDYWEVTYNYTNGTDTIAKVSDKPTVKAASGKIRYQSFKGTDNTSYFLALVGPTVPKVGTNDITAYLYKKVDMYTFIPVENYTVEIDPRMPDMDNHTSPNNVNLTYDATAKIYKGKLNLSMTGYWKINLIVKDANGTVLKGDAITGTTTASSIYFELEF